MSCHEITGDSAAPDRRSQQTTLDRCAAKPAARTRVTSASLNAASIACLTEPTRASGSCSTRPGAGVTVSTATDDRDTTAPRPSNTIPRLE